MSGFLIPGPGFSVPSVRSAQPIVAFERTAESDGTAGEIERRLSNPGIVAPWPLPIWQGAIHPLHLPMTHVLTLIAGNGDRKRMPGVVADVLAALRDRNVAVAPPDWLSPGMACDIHLSGAASTLAETVTGGRLAGMPIDFAVQPAAGRRKRLLVADMESTIITRELIDELANFAGLGPQIAVITGRSMRGEIDFAQSLRERVAMLGGLPIQLLERVEERIDLMPGACPLVKTMAANGCQTVLISGGFDRFASIVARICGFDEFYANKLEVAGGKLTGKVADPIIDRVGKRDIFERVARRLGLPLEACVAVGDGANDIDMLQLAGLGVAFHAKPAVAAAARFRLDHADLTGLLYLQGYRSKDFME